MNEAGISNLRLAIIIRAIEDYKELLQGAEPTASRNKKEIEAFFKSDYFDALTTDMSLKGIDIINLIRNEVEHE